MVVAKRSKPSIGRLLPGWVLAGLQLLALAACGGHTGSEVRYVDPVVKAYLDRAEGAIRKKSYRVALALVDSAAARKPDLPDVFFVRGRALLEMQRYEDAYSAFRKGVERAPEFRGGWYYFGNSAFRLRRYREALNHYAREAEAYGFDAGLYFNQGRAYAQLGVTDSARTAYHAALRTDSTYSDAYYWLAQLEQDGGELEKALGYWRLALRLQPNHLDIRAGTGATLVGLRRFPEAVATLEPVVEQNPRHEGALFNLGQAYIRMGRPGAARRVLDRLEQVRRTKAHIQDLQRAANQDRNNPERWLTLAAALKEGGYIDSAINAYAVAAGLVPGNLALQNNLANLYVASGDTMEALYRYYTILRKDSTLADVWLNVGVLNARAGHHAAARRAWQAALRFDPGHAEARRYLATLDTSERTLRSSVPSPGRSTNP